MSHAGVDRLTKEIYGMPTEDQKTLGIIGTFSNRLGMVKPLVCGLERAQAGNNSATELKASAR